MLNLASTGGLVCIGFLTDRYHISTVLLISAVCSSISVFLIWGLATTLPVLCVFAFAYGVFAGGYTATWTGCVTEVKAQNPNAATAVIMGAFASGRGIGCVMSGFVCDSLIGLTDDWHGKGAYGTQYAGLVLFTGITMVFGGFGVLGRGAVKSNNGVEGRLDEERPLIQ